MTEAVLRPELVGRAGERSLVEAAIAGGHRLVLIDGEPGVGKTRLLEHLVERAEAAGRTVLAGSATEFERLVPFGVYVDAFTRLSDTAPEGGPAEAALGTLLSAGKADQLDRYHTYRSIRSFLARLADDCGAVVALDDLHWADAPSLELTEFLLRRPPAAGFTLALACRTGTVPPVIAEAVARRDPHVTRLSLAPLDEDAAALLVPPQVDPGRRRLMYRASGGNPLFLRALLDADDRLLSELAEGRPGATLALEQTLLAVLRRELDRLTPAGRRAAHAAAVAGELASPVVISHVAELDAASAAAAVDELCRHGLGTLAGARFAFRHPLVRAAAYDTCGAAWRVAAHARVAGHLRRTDGSLALLAHHTERCAEPGDERAARTLGDAGIAYLDSAPATAVRLLREALRVLPERDDLVPYRGRLLTGLARGTGVMGSLTESRRILHEVIHLPPEVASAAVAFSSVISRMLGRLDEAQALLSAQTRKAEGRVRAQLLAELAAVAMLRSDPGGARRHAREALALVSETADPALEAAAYALMGVACMQDGDLAAARAHSRRAGWLMDSASDTALVPHVELIAPLSWSEIFLGRPADAERHLTRGVELATMSGRSYAMPYLLIGQAQLNARTGQLAEAIEIAEHAAAASEYIRSSETLAMARCVLLLPVLWRHGIEAALALAGSLAANGPGSAWWQAMAYVPVARVGLAGQAGPDHRLPPVLTRDTEVERLAVQSIRAGADGDVGTALARSAAAVEAAGDLPYRLGLAHDARARALCGHDDLPGAVTAARISAERFAESGAVVERGLAHQLLATLHDRMGDAAASRAEIGRAKAAYRESGADWLAARLTRVERRLAARGQRHAARETALTGREREVAELISQGLTNREVAERLQVSQKTVETHVSRIFSKYDVRSRVALARRLSGGDLPAGRPEPPAGS
ncbi:DNA-binding CsgD family transcriptional regulator [Nonomuraea thailandensis]|uniref:DNA-binding CsgD family transcriptional regulator n=1 Tax=Nonomuraea thailandensis TaxID=1188745 RepID=A0A9X2GDQ0_9ACTN|nr:helix-turn-helix transcriptional regulator [Nonomuraea thailandensis]MCP2356942.1 DNA-binding CsgD family transcriptional regulator [Nonomuraea thailandensis]